MNMSFFLTTQQMRARRKRVTRRNGWKHLKPGTVVNAIVKGQGLKTGEKVERICTILIVRNQSVPLNTITPSDVLAEGFATCLDFGETFCNRHNLNTWAAAKPEHFIRFYCDANKGRPDQKVQRIEFDFLETLREIEKALLCKNISNT